jgi:hypothetical protein
MPKTVEHDVKRAFTPLTHRSHCDAAIRPSPQNIKSVGGVYGCLRPCPSVIGRHRDTARRAVDDERNAAGISRKQPLGCEARRVEPEPITLGRRPSKMPRAYLELNGSADFYEKLVSLVEE